MRRGFAAFVTNAAHQQGLQAASLKVVARVRALHLLSAMVALVDNSAEVRCQRQRMETAVTHHRRQSLRCSLLQLHGHSQARLGGRQMRLISFHHWSVNCQTAMVHLWAEHAKRRKRWRTVLEAHRWTFLHRALDAWSTNAQESRAHRSRVALLQSKRSQHMCGLTLRGWQGWTRHLQEVTSEVDKQLQAEEQGRLEELLASWHRRSRRRAQLSERTYEAASRRCVRMLRRSLLWLREEAGHKQERDRLRDRAAAQRRRFLVLAALSRWVSHWRWRSAERAVLLTAALQKLRRCIADRHFGHWLQFLELRRRKCLQRAASDRQRRFGLLRESFLQWVRLLSFCQLQQESLRAVVPIVVAVTSRSALSQWRCAAVAMSWWLQKRRQRLLQAWQHQARLSVARWLQAGGLAAKQRLSSCKAPFASWVFTVAWRSRAKAFEERQRLRQLWKVLSEWHAVCKWFVRRRHEAIALLPKRLLRLELRCWVAWQIEHQQSQSRRQLQQSFQKKTQKQLEKVAFRSWRWARLQAKRSFIEQECFRVWSQYHCERALQRSQVAQGRQLLGWRWAIRRWQSRQRATLRRREQLARQQSNADYKLRRRSLRAWTLSHQGALRQRERLAVFAAFRHWRSWLRRKTSWKVTLHLAFAEARAFNGNHLKLSFFQRWSWQVTWESANREASARLAADWQRARAHKERLRRQAVGLNEEERSLLQVMFGAWQWGHVQRQQVLQRLARARGRSERSILMAILDSWVTATLPARRAEDLRRRRSVRFCRPGSGLWAQSSPFLLPAPQRSQLEPQSAHKHPTLLAAKCPNGFRSAPASPLTLLRESPGASVASSPGESASVLSMHEKQVLASGGEVPDPPRLGVRKPTQAPVLPVARSESSERLGQSLTSAAGGGTGGTATPACETPPNKKLSAQGPGGVAGGCGELDFGGGPGALKQVKLHSMGDAHCKGGKQPASPEETTELEPAAVPGAGYTSCQPRGRPADKHSILRFFKMK